LLGRKLIDYISGFGVEEVKKFLEAHLPKVSYYYIDIVLDHDARIEQPLRAIDLTLDVIGTVGATT
jgi:hypothetical protein